MKKNNDIEISYNELKINLERIKEEIDNVVNQMQEMQIAKIKCNDDVNIILKLKGLALKYNELLHQYFELEALEIIKNRNIEQSLITNAINMQFSKKH